MDGVAEMGVGVGDAVGGDDSDGDGLGAADTLMDGVAVVVLVVDTDGVLDGLALAVSSSPKSKMTSDDVKLAWWTSTAMMLSALD